MPAITDSYEFFLGGHDLEMLAIRDLLAAEGCIYHDKGLAWGAKASDYRDEIGTCVRRSRVPVLIELPMDIEPPPSAFVVVDHHRPLPPEPTSLRKLSYLLGLPPERWTRRMDLISANDHGHIAAMLAAGAGEEEVRRIRAEDRSAQGVTAADEQAAIDAAASIRILADGRLHLAHLPSSRCSPLTDRLHPALGGPGYENLLVISPTEANFFGEARLVDRLDNLFPYGWTGGGTCGTAFWGHPLAGSRYTEDAFLDALTRAL